MSPSANVIYRAPILALLAGFAIGLLADSNARADRPPLGFTFEGHIDTTLEARLDWDLDRTTPADLGTIQPELEVSLGFRPLEQLGFLTTWQINRDFVFLDGGARADRPERLELLVAQVEITEIADIFSLYAGRMDLLDRRAWLFDTELDGVLLMADLNRVQIELSVTREEAFEKDFLNPDTEEPVNNYFFNGDYEVSPYALVSAYVLVRDARSGPTVRPILIGLRSWGRRMKPFNHWLEFSHVRGRDGANRIRGWAVDVGGTYVFDGRLMPYLTMGFALGSGDQDADDGTDRAFRQSGLGTNQHRLGGVARVKRYGELLNPQLTNLAIYTVGGGFRPWPRTSVELVYHHVRQVVARDDLGPSRLGADPTGASKALGHEIDLVASFREIADFRAELVLGYFIPGAAFPANAASAFFTQFQLRYAF